MVLFTAAFFIIAAVPILAHAQQINCETPEGINKYYVAMNGSDSNPGTEGAPFRTIKACIAKLKAGDTLYIREGTYTGSSAFNALPSGTSWDNAVSIRSYPGETVKLIPETGVNVLSLNNKQYIIFDGFIFDGKGGHNGVKGYKSHHIRIINTEVMNAPGQGIPISEGTNYWEFINLRVHDNGTSDFDHGIYVTDSYNLIMGSEFYRNAGWGIHVYSGAAWNPSHNVIINNKTYDNAQVGNRLLETGVQAYEGTVVEGSRRAPGIGIHSGEGNIAANNKSWGNVSGIRVNTKNTILCNNNLHNNDQYGIYIYNTKGAKVGPNEYSGNGTGDILNQGTNTDMNFTGCADVLAKLPTASGSCGTGPGPSTQTGGLQLKDINCIPPGNPVDLKITVPPGATGTVFLGGLLPGFTLSAGTPVPNTNGVIWEVPISAVPILTVTPPSGFKGQLGLSVSLIPPF